MFSLKANTTAVAPAAPEITPGCAPRHAVLRPINAAACRPTMGDTPATNVNARDSGTMASDTVTPASTCPINEEVSAGAVSAVSVLASSALGDTVSPRTRRHRRVAVRTAMHERPGRGLNDLCARVAQASRTHARDDTRQRASPSRQMRARWSE